MKIKDLVAFIATLDPQMEVGVTNLSLGGYIEAASKMFVAETVEGTRMLAIDLPKRPYTCELAAQPMEDEPRDPPPTDEVLKTRLEVIRKVALERGLKVVDLPMSKVEPSDMMGLPKSPIDPIKYVFRTHRGYFIAPFDEDVATKPENDKGPFGPNEILDLIKDIDVSLMMGPDGGDVSWVHGSDVTHEGLAQMQISKLRE